MQINVNELVKVCGFTGREEMIVRGIFKTTKASGPIGTPRKAKPKVKYEKRTRADGREYYIPEDISGTTAYVWRMFMFYTQNTHPYCCMPVTAEWDLPYDSNDDYSKKRELADAADKIVR